MIRILLCGEGDGDVGQMRTWDRARREHVDTEGWLQPLVRKILGRQIAFESRSRDELIVLPRDRNRHRPLPPGHGAKVLLAKIIAANEEFDAIIFMVDADGASRREWQRKRQQILSAFEMVALEVPSFPCVPKATSESWLLADPNAWRQLGLEDTSDLPVHPEDGWGNRSDPNGNHPHQSFARACRKSGLPDSRETRVSIAENANLAVISEKCPVSFGAFQADLTREPIRGRDCNCGNVCCE